MEADDESLVENFRKLRNPNSFKPLVQRYQSQLYNIAYRMIGNHEETEEMVQEAFLRVFVNFDKLNKNSSFYAWLLTITNNLCRDLLRVRQRRKALHLFSLDQTDNRMAVAEISDYKTDPARKFEELEQLAVIEKSLARLPADQRVVVVLRDIEGLPYHKIADITGTNLGTVRSRLHYARLKLRIMLEPYLDRRSQGVEPGRRVFGIGLSDGPGLTDEVCLAVHPIPVPVSRRQL